MLLCPIVRADLLRLLPTGGEIAEIGVQRGDFSAVILETVRPTRLHLIDCWRHQERADYIDGCNISEAEHEALYRGTLARFAGAIGEGTVVVHRELAADAAHRFADGSLDWIYLDAMHDFASVRADLAAYFPKVKPGGLILGHDYTNHGIAQERGYGVVEAVDAFVAETGCQFVALTHENFPTYVLGVSGDSPAVRHLRAKILYHVPFMVEIREPAGKFQHKDVAVLDRRLALPSF